MVVCRVPDEPSLLAAYERTLDRDIRATLFREPDIGNQATAFASEPISGRARRVFKKYPLWTPCTQEALR